MPIFSAENPGTLGAYRQLMLYLFGEESPAVTFLNNKIAESPYGVDEVVLQDETQMLLMLSDLEYGRHILSK